LFDRLYTKVQIECTKVLVLERGKFTMVKCCQLAWMGRQSRMRLIASIWSMKNEKCTNSTGKATIPCSDHDDRVTPLEQLEPHAKIADEGVSKIKTLISAQLASRFH